MLSPPLCGRSFYDRDAPIYTMSRFLPPSKVQDSEVNNSILGDGCVIRAGSRINHSVIGLRALINENCTVDDALIMGADYYETLEECALVPGCLPMGLGAPLTQAVQCLLLGECEASCLLCILAMPLGACACAADVYCFCPVV